MAINVIFNNIPGMADAIKAEVAKIIEITAADVEARAKEKAPVLTGNLRSSISHAVSPSNPLNALVTVAANYGLYVEVGTHKMAAQPYLRPAMEAAKEGFVSGIQTAIEAAAKGVSAAASPSPLSSEAPTTAPNPASAS